MKQKKQKTRKDGAQIEETKQKQIEEEKQKKIKRKSIPRREIRAER